MTDLLPAPAEPRRPPPHLSEDYPLERQVATTLEQPAPWARAAVMPVAAVVGLAVLLPLVVITTGLPRHGDVTAAYSLVGECLLGVVIVLAGRPVARSNHGWQPAFGLTPPTRADTSPIVAWSGIQFGVRFALGVILSIAVPWLRHHHPSNLTGIDSLGAAGLAMFLVAGVVVAPVVEELIFRGAMLRALMRRISFWPAAGISSLTFGLLHAPTASSWQGALVLVLMTYVFGIVQCLLVRQTGRLTPAIGVHAITNLIAIGLALAFAS